MTKTHRIVILLFLALAIGGGARAAQIKWDINVGFSGFSTNWTSALRA